MAVTGGKKSGRGIEAIDRFQKTNWLRNLSRYERIYQPLTVNWNQFSANNERQKNRPKERKFAMSKEYAVDSTITAGNP